jgi:hypothetical protein
MKFYLGILTMFFALNTANNLAQPDYQERKHWHAGKQPSSVDDLVKNSGWKRQVKVDG